MGHNGMHPVHISKLPKSWETVGGVYIHKQSIKPNHWFMNTGEDDQILALRLGRLCSHAAVPKLSSHIHTGRKVFLMYKWLRTFDNRSSHNEDQKLMKVLHYCLYPNQT